MSKQKRDLIKDKKYIILIGIILVVIIIVVVFMLTRKTNNIKEEGNITKLTEEYNKNNNTDIKENVDNTPKDTNKELNEKVESNSNSTNTNNTNSNGEVYDIGNILYMNEEQIDLKGTDFSNFISDKINKDNLDTLYQMLNKNYIDTFNYDEETFEMNYFFNGDIISEVTNIEIPTEKDRMFVTLNLTQVANGASLIKDFTIFNDGTIADIIIKSMSDLEYNTTIDNVQYKISKRIDTRLGAIYKIDIVNNSENLIQIKDMLIENKNVIYSYEVVSDNTVLESYPGIDFTFMIKVPNNYDIDHLVLKCIDFNGKDYDITILDKYS